VALFGKKAPREEPLTETEAEIYEFFLSLCQSAYGPTESLQQKVLQGMRDAIRESKADGSYWLPFDVGDLVLSGTEPSKPGLRRWVASTRATLAQKRYDGMTDDDFREYWNDHELARRMAIVAMNIARTAAFTHALEEREWDSLEKAMEGAAARVRMFHAHYDHPNGAEDISDPHRPLPFEVQTRVTKLLDAESEDPEVLRARLEEVGTVNAFYRASLA